MWTFKQVKKEGVGYGTREREQKETVDVGDIYKNVSSTVYCGLHILIFYYRIQSLRGNHSDTVCISNIQSTTVHLWTEPWR